MKNKRSRTMFEAEAEAFFKRGEKKTKGSRGMFKWRNWSDDLPQDLIVLIVKRLHSYPDLVRFGAVCRSWRYVTTLSKCYKPYVQELPWLMLKEESGDDVDTCRFYHLSTKESYNLDLPEVCGRRCWSSFGWLITFGPEVTQLWNPLSRVEIPLPPQPIFPYPRTTPGHETVKKAVLSWSPSSSNHVDQCVVMTIDEKTYAFAFARPGDESWTTLLDARHGKLEDVVYFNGLFYAVSWMHGELWTCDVAKKEVLKVVARQRGIPNGRYFLVEMSPGVLNLVVRVAGNKRDFKVYELNFSTMTWVMINEFG